MFTVVDHSTRWAAAYPVQDTSTTACINSLNEWISCFGIPATVTYGLRNMSILFFELLTILRTDQAVFIYMNNMSLHFNDYEEKFEKKCFFSV